MDATPQRRKFGWLFGILGVVIVLLLWSFGSYNGLIRSKAAVDNSWAQVQTQYQRRFDLVPNLVSTVKGAANFEQQTLTQVTEARTKFLSGGSRSDQIAAAGQFESALSRLLVTVEAYPQLKATQAFSDLMAQLEGTENRIAVARKDYNDAVTTYNVKVRSFPAVIFASIFGFGPEKLFESSQGASQAPAVNFDQKSS
ncbi:MAG: LemA protein [Candidatus Peribacteria bacterium]|nr:LemA protein [Candidatus Peribacteria bacterium]